MITEDDFIEAGWQPGARLDRALAHALSLAVERGIADPKYLIKLAARAVGGADDRVSMRDDPAPLAEAIAAETPEEEQNLGASRRQIRELLRSPVAAAGALMPDACPAGKAQAAIPVGGVFAAEGALVPSAHGSDICCSVYCTVFEAGAEPSAILDALMGVTRFGPGGRAEGERIYHPVLDEPVWDNPFLTGLQRHAAMHLADQGDGNHFAYLGRLALGQCGVAALDAAGYGGDAQALRPDREYYALVTHHGSRGLGAHLFKRGQNAAEKHVRRAGQGIPEEAAWLPADSAEGEAYWEALQYAGRWARANHRCIHDLLAESIQAEPLWGFGCEHNFVWRRGDRFLHGKGATPAWRGEDGRPLLGLIPLNMAEPILLTIGADNAEFLSFSPHGAGRNRSRRATFKRYRQGGKIDFDAMRRDLDRQTRGIDVRWFSGKPDITEGPGGYKPAAVVRKQIAGFGLASVAAEITPLGCIMAGGNLKRDEEDPLTPKQKRQLQHRADRRRDKQRLQRGGWDD